MIASSSPLSIPARPRWQPLRLGLVDLYRYDSEEFPFRDGHLLLRGNNGTGKSKVLSLTLPFLFDANLTASRVEPDGDRGKRMEWNLLLNGAFERRIGYAWIEFGRRDDDGELHYFTLGAGLRAVAGRGSVEAWFFTTQLRVGDTLWLTTPERTALSRDRLIDALGGQGRVYANATEYRRAVDAALFGLGSERYAALIDTLIQLRQPQLSKQPNEQRLSGALSEALAPLDSVALEDVAAAMNQLEDYRRELDELARIQAAVAAFASRYRRYAQIASRRRARVLRQAQTEFDQASREVNEAVAARDAARARVKVLGAEQQEADQSLRAARARLALLDRDPVMRDAARLQDVAAQAETAGTLLQQAEARAHSAQARLDAEHEALQRRERDTGKSRRVLSEALEVAAAAARNAGIDRHAERFGDLVLPDGLAEVGEDFWQRIARDGAVAVDRRRAQIRLIRQRQRESAEAVRGRDLAREQARLRSDAFEQARAAAVQALSAQRARIDDSGADWREHLSGLTVLAGATLLDQVEAFAAWAECVDGANPLRQLLHAQWGALQVQLAQREAQLQHSRAALDEEHFGLRAERAALEAGVDRPPAPAGWRQGAPSGHGRPLWQLLDFRVDCDDATRSGLEAALEASGLLDAWIDAAGALRDPDYGELLLQPRAGQPSSLAAWLRPTLDSDAMATGMTAERIDALLDSIACGPCDDGVAEAWLSPQGRFRLGPARGAWGKPAAEYIGFAARAAARQQRLAAIATRLDEIAQSINGIDSALAEVETARAGAQRELEQAPPDEPLQQAALAALAAEQARRAEQILLGEAEGALARAEQGLSRAAGSLRRDAEDVGLPIEAAPLDDVDAAVQDYRLGLQAALGALRGHAGALTERAAQQARVAITATDAEQSALEHDERRNTATIAAAEFATLRATVGIQVEALQRQIAEAGREVSALEREVSRLSTDQKSAIGEAGAAAQKADDRKMMLDERQIARQQAIERLQAFAATGLIEDAIDAIDLPAREPAWGIEHALTLARRVEQALLDIAAEDEDWARIQKPLGGDLQTLQQAMSAQGHQAFSELVEECMVVRIVHQQRPQRPEAVLRQVAAEVAERQQLLSAREREVLENHLQQEIAVDLQVLIRDTEARIEAINLELARRPTSTGVRFKLVWEPLPEGDEGAPYGLAEARGRLLRTSADAWSTEDRRVVGTFLQARIESERQRDDRPLLESLTRALDYRAWHRFRVLRQQDGRWKPLAGPASSGERALGLTVPLFAAASSHYRSARSDAPRLVLLDEAFAGIDDEARANCMALIREFDLDFVMTSEREWGCYAELPGVAICQLIRREGIDAVFVSRWWWDGRSRRSIADPERRFPSTRIAME